MSVFHLDSEYDYVAIVDFLPDEDRKREQIGVKLSTWLKRHQIGWHRLDCHNGQSVIGALRWLATESRAGKVFCIHFIGHGDSTGLVMPDRSILQWANLAPALKQFPPQMLSQTIVNMSCCFGINGIKLSDHLPFAQCFFGVLGPAAEITFRSAWKLNGKVYGKMIEGKSVNSIIREVNSEFGKQVLYGITSAGYRILKNSVTRVAQST